jgi:hypothetical protein
VVVLLAAGAVWFAAGGVSAQVVAEPPDGDGGLVTVCSATPLEEVPELGAAGCKFFDSFAVALAGLCGTLAPHDACTQLTDGRDVDPATIDAFEGGWVQRALRLQSRLDERSPLRLGLFAHTHNAGNSSAYAPSLSIMDPNQRHTILDQLRMGIRAIEVDLHWAPHPSGSLESGGNAVVDCHGTGQGIGPVTIHIGCSVDRLASESLAEIVREVFDLRPRAIIERLDLDRVEIEGTTT